MPFSAKPATTIAVHSHPMKRPRSPASPSDRPFKRVSLAVMNDSTSTPLLFVAGANIFQPHPTRMLSAEENWVTQTRGLRIERPLSIHPTQNQPPPLVGVRGYEREDDMGMDCDLLSNPQVCSWPSRTQDRPHTIRIQTMHLPSTQQLPTPPPEHQSIVLPSPDHVIQSPQVNARPVAPSETLGRNDSMDSVMLISSPSSQRLSVPATPIPPSARKQKFTMGPRGDCEKCRMGLKGHWVHVD